MKRPRASPISRLGGFVGNPLQIRRKAVDNGDSDDLGKFVGVLRSNRRFDLRIARRLGLDGNGNFLRSFDFAAPVIE